MIHKPVLLNEMLTALTPEQGKSYIDGTFGGGGYTRAILETGAHVIAFDRDPFVEGPLDMRMGDSKTTAELVVNTYTEKDLADIIYTYGEEHKSRFIAKLIVQNRPFHTTKQLANLLSKHMKGKPHLHPATLTFQALRIYVNDELHEIQNGLTAALSLLKPEGRIVTVSFHALEDRIVKQFFKTHHLQSPYKHVITPSKQELLDNPRSRSARLRCGILHP